MQLFQPVNAHTFLSGDILSKLEKAEEALEFDSSFEEEVRMLNRILPISISIADVDIAIGVTWIPPKYYEQFCKQVLDVDVSFFFSAISGNWDIDLRKGNSPANNITYGYSYTKEVNGKPEVVPIPAVGKKIEDGLFTMSMHFKVPSITDKTSRREATLKQDELRRIWSDWCKEGERGLELERLYNRKFNRLVLPNWDNSAPPGFVQILVDSGMSQAWANRLRPYQLDSIWRMAIGGNSLLGLEVGLGKTSVAIATAMLRKHYKTSHKAMFIVQKSTLGQFHKTFMEMYPKATVLCATPNDLAGIGRQKFLAKAAFWDFDAIIITHESFKAIPTRVETERVFIEHKLAVIESDLEDLYAKGETSKKIGKKRGNRIVKKLEEMRDKLWMYVEKITSHHDVGVHFEDINPSMLVVDECQRFKNNYFATKIQAKGINLSISQRSEDFDLKLSYMRKAYPNNNFLLMITGTPEPTNSMTGVYVFQSYLQPEELAKRGLMHFDAWATAFGRVVSRIEPGVGGDLRTSERFAEFINVPELLQMYLSVCHIKRFDDVAGQAGFTRPSHKVKRVSTPLSAFQIYEMDEIAKRRALIEDDSPRKFVSRDKAGYLLDKEGKRLVHPSTKEPIKEEKVAIALGLEWGVKIDNHLWLVTDARKLMIASQLLDPEEPIDRMDKINQAVRRIHRWWRITKKQRSTQLVFLDMGTPGGSAQFPLYDWMKEQLINRGIPKSEIAFVQDYSKDEAKEWLFNEVNAGNIRVLFGSTEPLGVGVNVQSKIKVVHFIDIPRRPDQYEQRLGRAVRSGNENESVLVYQYLTQGQGGNFGADAAQMHLLQTKLKSREQILRGDPTVRRVVEEDDQLLLFMMLSAHATGDVRFLRYMECKSELEIEESRSNLLLREINRINVGSSPDSVPRIKEDIAYVERQTKECVVDVALTKKYINECATPDKFAILVKDTLYAGIADPCEIPGPLKLLSVKQAQILADAHLQQIIETITVETRLNLNDKTNFYRSSPHVIGEFGGMPILCKVYVESKIENVDLWLKGQRKYDFKYRISEQRLIRNIVERYTEVATSDTYLYQRLDNLNKELETSIVQLRKKRGERDEVNAKVQILKQEKACLESELSINSDI